VYALRLSHATALTAADVGYVEVWNQFRTWTPHIQGMQWTPSAPAGGGGGGGGGGQRVATITLTELLLPRRAVIRSTGGAITSVPYLWCLVRHSALEPVSTLTNIYPRVTDTGRGRFEPPAWTRDRTAIAFQLTVAGARIPGECQFISLSGTVPVRALARGSVTAALPEFCLLLPSGEVLDFVQYRGDAPLPPEAYPDETAGITVTLVVEMTAVGSADAATAGAPESKRARIASAEAVSRPYAT
jgi:hypothetical protein